MKINHNIQLQDNKLKHFLNIKSLPKTHIVDIINRADQFHENGTIPRYHDKVGS
jgi:hypothetical protein